MTLASQIALGLGCCQAARLFSGRDPRPLVAATREAFDRVLRLGTEGERPS